MTSIRSLLTVACILLFSSSHALGQAPGRDPGATTSPDGLWQLVEDVEFREGFRPPSAFSAWTIDLDMLKALLVEAPRETFGPIPPQTRIWLPLPDGRFVEVAVAQSQLMEPALVGRFPQIRTYVFKSLGAAHEDRENTAGHAVLADGLNSWYVAAPSFNPGASDGLLQITPVDTDAGRVYLSFFDHDRAGGVDDLVNLDDEDEHTEGPPVPVPDSLVAGDQLRIYRFAAATTGEFYRARCNCDPGQAGTFLADLAVVVSLVSDIAGVNALFEPEISVRLQLANATAQLLYDDPDTDPFDNSDTACDLAGDNLTNTQSVVGDDEYDIGLVLATKSGGGNGGCAKSGSVCGVNKAGTASKIGNDGTNSASGNIAHEVGHKLLARHTFSGKAGKCTESQFSSESAYEPGSGTTRMSYKGLCEDKPAGEPGDIVLVPFDDNVDVSAVKAGSYFHSRSIDEIVQNVFGGEGSTCGFLAPSANLPPFVNAGPDYTIPRQTPFTLIPAFASDSEPLVFNWEQFDRADTRRPIDSAHLADGPIVRSVPPGSDPARTIPRLQDLLAGVTRKGEVLSEVDREMNFRFIARDNLMGGGGVAYDSMKINVEGEPFFITSPNGGVLQAACQAPLTWQVGGGSVAPFVSVLFSSDGGQNFDTVVAPVVANDGAFPMTVPCATGNQGRIKLQALGNIFFDISDSFGVANTPPEVNVSAAGGSVNHACQFKLNFSAAAADTCGLSATDVSVELIKAADNFTLGTPTININQVSVTEVGVTGSVLVSDLFSSPAHVTVRLRAVDACGAATVGFADVAIVDDTPPEIAASVDPSVLWPPDHSMVPIQATVLATDNCSGVSFVLTSLTSSEPDNGVADGNTVDDIQAATVGTPDTTFLLRAERAANGGGRIYTATYTATDGSQNTAQASPTVVVPIGPIP